MNSLKWKQQSKRTYALEDSYGKTHVTLENRTCSESNITDAFLEECKQDFLANKKQKGRTL